MVLKLRTQKQGHFACKSAFPTPVPLPCASCPGRSSDNALWLGWGWFAVAQLVFTAAFAAHVWGHFADLFWDLRRLSRPILRTHFWNHGFGFLNTGP